MHFQRFSLSFKNFNITYPPNIGYGEFKCNMTFKVKGQGHGKIKVKLLLQTSEQNSEGTYPTHIRGGELNGEIIFWPHPLPGGLRVNLKFCIAANSAPAIPR